MSDRYCIRCGQVILPSQEGDLCVKCLDKKLNYGDLYYDAKDVARIMGISDRHVRRKYQKGELPRRARGIKRYLWLKSRFDQWWDEGQPIPRTPTSPIQEKAYAMCQRNDHSWMKDEEYAGDCYNRETRTDKGQYHITVGFVHTCYFCGYKEYFYF